MAASSPIRQPVRLLSSQQNTYVDNMLKGEASSSPPRYRVPRHCKHDNGGSRQIHTIPRAKCNEACRDHPDPKDMDMIKVFFRFFGLKIKYSFAMQYFSFLKVTFGINALQTNKCR